MLSALIFDIDGTLVDSNPAHVEAWARAFERHGYKVLPDRIEVEIGKGGDKLVPDVLGDEAEARDGESLREAQTEEFLRIARSRRLRAFPGVRELVADLRKRGIRTALATSSGAEHLQGLAASSGLDLAHLTDELVNADDIDESKPAPDVVLAATAKLDLSPAECAIIGDTPYDAESARAAGVAALGVLSGGNDESVLRRAGARGVWAHIAAIHADLEGALACASPGAFRLETAALDRFMREAIAEARQAVSAGELPSGAIVVSGSGAVLARAQHEVVRSGNATAHAVLRAVWQAAPAIAGERGALVVSTLEPCVMCAGAAEVAGVDMIVFGRQSGPAAASRRVIPRSRGTAAPRLLGGVLEREVQALTP